MPAGGFIRWPDRAGFTGDIPKRVVGVGRVVGRRRRDGCAGRLFVALPLVDGPGMLLSSRMSSTVAFTAPLLVAPIRTSAAGLLIVSPVLLANAVPNAASPVAR